MLDDISCIICKRIPDHITMHMSDILYEDIFGIKWRAYWNGGDWGSYLVDEAGQTFDFWKSVDMILYVEAMDHV